MRYDKYWDAVSREASALDDAEMRGEKRGAMNERIANILSFSKILSAEQISEALGIAIEEVERIIGDDVNK